MTHPAPAYCLSMIYGRTNSFVLENRYPPSDQVRGHACSGSCSTAFPGDIGSLGDPMSPGNAVDSCVGACPCRRTGSHFAGTCARFLRMFGPRAPPIPWSAGAAFSPCAERSRFPHSRRRFRRRMASWKTPSAICERPPERATRAPKEVCPLAFRWSWTWACSAAVAFSSVRAVTRPSQCRPDRRTCRSAPRR
jgi:hypothetical protein